MILSEETLAPGLLEHSLQFSPLLRLLFAPLLEFFPLVGPSLPLMTEVFLISPIVSSVSLDLRLRAYDPARPFNSPVEIYLAVLFKDIPFFSL